MTRIRLHRHPECLRCARISRVHAALDWLKRIDCTTDPAPSGSLKMGEIEVRDVRTGATFKGVEAVRLIARQVPAYWPLLPLLSLPPIARRIDRDVRGCEDGRCSLPAAPPREEAATSR